MDRHGRQIRAGRSSADDQSKPAVADTSQAEESVLEAFDLDYAFGPSNGITRLRRWERAKRLGLDPPEEVKQIIERHGATSEYNESLWTGHLSGIVSTR